MQKNDSMVGGHIYQSGSRVEVWLRSLGPVARGIVFGSKQRDGVWIYFVQLSGYASAHMDNPDCWFTAAELRPAP